jgi:hypothetical protein
MGTIWDPLRRKDVALTPEEQVRQWFIANLRDALGVPVHMMGSEVSFEFGRKHYRADIVVYSRSGSPLAVVECKRPDVEISSEVARQAMRYNAVLDVKFIFLTNGKNTYIYGRDASGVFVPMDHAPGFEEMLCRQ